MGKLVQEREQPGTDVVSSVEDDRRNPRVGGHEPPHLLNGEATVLDDEDPEVFERFPPDPEGAVVLRIHPCRLLLVVQRYTNGLTDPRDRLLDSRGREASQPLRPRRFFVEKIEERVSLVLECWDPTSKRTHRRGPGKRRGIPQPPELDFEVSLGQPPKCWEEEERERPLVQV